jgi:hypothetical protein
MIFGPPILETLHSLGNSFCHVLNIPEAGGVFSPIKQYCNIQVFLLHKGYMWPVQSIIYFCEPIIILFRSMLGSWNSSVYIQITLCILWPESIIQFLAGTIDFPLLFPPQYPKHYGVHPVPVYSVPGTIPPPHPHARVTMVLRWPPTFSAMVKNVWSYACIPPYTYMVQCLGKHRYNHIYFLLLYILKCKWAFCSCLVYIYI